MAKPEPGLEPDRASLERPENTVSLILVTDIVLVNTVYYFIYIDTISDFATMAVLFTTSVETHPISKMWLASYGCRGSIDGH